MIVFNIFRAIFCLSEMIFALNLRLHHSKSMKWVYSTRDPVYIMKGHISKVLRLFFFTHYTHTNDRIRRIRGETAEIIIHVFHSGREVTVILITFKNLYEEGFLEIPLLKIRSLEFQYDRIDYIV